MRLTVNAVATLHIRQHLYARVAIRAVTTLGSMDLWYLPTPPSDHHLAYAHKQDRSEAVSAERLSPRSPNIVWRESEMK